MNILQPEFGLFRKLTRYCAAALGAKVFVYMKYRKFVYMWYSFHANRPFRNISRSQTVLAPNAPGTTAPGLDALFENSPSQINPWRRLWQSLSQYNRCLWKKALGKRIPGKNCSRKNAPPWKRYPPEMLLPSLNTFGTSVRRQVLAKKACHQ